MSDASVDYVKSLIQLRTQSLKRREHWRELALEQAVTRCKERLEASIQAKPWKAEHQISVELTKEEFLLQVELRSAIEALGLTFGVFLRDCPYDSGDRMTAGCDACKWGRKDECPKGQPTICFHCRLPADATDQPE